MWLHSLKVAQLLCSAACLHTNQSRSYLNHLVGRTTPLTSRCCILYIYSTNIGTEYFKHAANSPFFPLQNVVYFIMLPFFGFCVTHILYTECAKIKNKNSGAKGLTGTFRVKGLGLTKRPLSSHSVDRTGCTYKGWKQISRTRKLLTHHYQLRNLEKQQKSMSCLQTCKLYT